MTSIFPRIEYSRNDEYDEHIFCNLFYLLLYYRPGSAAAVDICSPRLSSRPRREEEMLVNVASINQRQVRKS